MSNRADRSTRSRAMACGHDRSPIDGGAFGHRDRGSFPRKRAIYERVAMKLRRRQFLHLAAGAAALFALTNTTLAQDWPTRPVTLVVTAAAGGPNDLLARILAPRMGEILGQPVIIENIVGAGGMTGMSRVAMGVPDGYHFVIAVPIAPGTPSSREDEQPPFPSAPRGFL
jgi:Tripartite tricarboxylate transporter family receptor